MVMYRVLYSNIWNNSIGLGLSGRQSLLGFYTIIVNASPVNTTYSPGHTVHRNHGSSSIEAEHILPTQGGMNEMANLGPRHGNLSCTETGFTVEDEQSPTELSSTNSAELSMMLREANGGQTVYKVYKRRWFGLTQLVLLNVVVSWDWLSFSAVANTAATHFSTTSSRINWLSTGFLFAFVAAAPLTLYTLHKGGPRPAIIASSCFILIGNWLRYAGTRTATPSFPLTMAGQILIGLAQPFVLSAPTQYSELWFSPNGRVSATALASLANPFGGALGQLICPFLASKPAEIPNMTLYVAVISSIATIPSFFIPAAPPTPSSPSSNHIRPSIRENLSILSSSQTFYCIFILFATYVGFFNSISSLLTQILSPYSFSETESGISGALLILVGLVSAAITSPFIDRSKAYVPFIKILVPIIALSYVVFIWAPPTRTVAAPYVILSVLGAASFSLVPVALEYLAEATFPAGPEAGSTICWAGGQLLGGVFLVISDALKAGEESNPPYHMRKALVFQAVVAMAVVPAAMTIGWFGGEVRKKRLDLDKAPREHEREST